MTSPTDLGSRALSSSPPASVVPHSAGFFRRHAGKLVASAVITFLIVYTIHKGGMKFLPTAADFHGVRWWTVPLYLVTFAGMTWFRSVRWRFLLRSMAEVPKARLLAVSCVGFAAIQILPFRLGEIVRPYMIRTKPSERRSGARAITMTAATSSVVAERIVDGLYLSTILALALVFVPTVHPLPDHVVGLPITVAQVRWSGFAMLGLFGVLFTTIAVFYVARSWAHGATLVVFGKVSRRLAEKLAGMAEKLADGLHVFGRGKDALGFFLETSAYWFCNAAGMWMLAWGCGVLHADATTPTFGEALGLMGMLGCTILIPGPPGMLGVFQAGIYAGMTMYYPESVVLGAGAAYVFTIYILQVLFQVLFAVGGLWYVGGGRGLRGGFQELEAAEGAIVPGP
ncbi:MAG TPA: lysylphosphatidylglycerol synthase transmembrane domain-containing protein [Polyangiaceae bacterium]